MHKLQDFFFLKKSLVIPSNKTLFKNFEENLEK